MMGDNVDDKTLPAPLTATPVKIREDRLSDLRKKSAASKVAAARIIREKNTKPSKTPLAQRAKSIGNTSSYPKNIIYFEDQIPLISISEGAVENGIDNNILMNKYEQKLHETKSFDKDQVFLYYCLQHLRETGISMSEFHICHKNKFSAGVKKHPVAKKILKKESINPQHYQHEQLVSSGRQNPNHSNSPSEKVANMRAYFVDSDGVSLDEFIESRSEFKPQKISSTVAALSPFFHSAMNWIEGDVKFLGLVHPNAEGIKFTSLNNNIDFIQANHNIKFSAIGYGYRLPAAYRVSVHRRDPLGGEPIPASPHITFGQNFQDEILIRLKNNFSSNCNDLMEGFNNSPELINTTYCENQSISAYISKATGDPESSNLDTICDKLEPKMIKNVFMNTNFVTLYRVEKIDNDHITIVKEILKEPAKESLENKLDEMLARLKN